ncbi:clathrin light chain A isoform X3 [Globicephala melas]|uniref:clathrin light chain A isoform X3 n=1 Tax=Globicephala melas TaxID=9731 RepID=UPI00293D9318|nr:clathrin light chain A isoform X3 [Globicephala melas]
MAELDPFGAHASGPALGNGVAGEEDPAAAFLAQQESEIAGIENDEAFAILDGGAHGPQPHGEPPGGPGVKILCCPRLLECEFSFVVSDNLHNHRCHCPASVFFSVKGADTHHTGLLGLYWRAPIKCLHTEPDAVEGIMNGEYYQESNGPTDSYAAISQVDRLQSEPESIRKWREEQTERLEALDANSRKQEAEWKEKAIKELDEWYARQDEQLQKTKANNSTNINHPCYSLEQAAEEAFVNDIEESSPGTEWERVARLCDFNPKSSKQAKDVSRMRSVLISLKQAPLVH